MMGQIFAAFGELELRDRFELGVGVRGSCSCFPVTAADFALLAVPRSETRSATFLNRLRFALPPVVDSHLSSWTLGDLVPRIAMISDVVAASAATTNRMIALVRANGHRTWSDLSGCTVREIRGWYGAGRQVTTQLVIAAVATALCSVQGEPDPGPETARGLGDPVCTTLRTVLADLPDQRGRFALELDELRLVEAATSTGRPAPHQFLSLSVERTRQLKVAAREQLLAACRHDAALEQRLGVLAARLGLAVDHDGVESVLHSLDLPSTSDPAGLLAVWLAGPYRRVPGHDGWWSPRPAELVDETKRALSMDGGVQPHAVAIEEMIHIGVTEAHADRWLSRQHVRIEHGLVVRLGGRVADVSARVLESTGRAMSSSELCSWMRPETVPPVLVTELNRSSMFVETGPDRWELADWGGEPYDGALGVRGSVRPIVLASGAAIGSVLRFVIDRRQSAVEVAVDRVAPTDESVTIQSISTTRSTA